MKEPVYRWRGNDNESYGLDGEGNLLLLSEDALGNPSWSFLEAGDGVSVLGQELLRVVVQNKLAAS